MRFTGIDSFEFTDEVAVFDLLGMQLLHGWLVDPQASTSAWPQFAMPLCGIVSGNALVLTCVCMSLECVP